MLCCDSGCGGGRTESFERTVPAAAFTVQTADGHAGAACDSSTLQYWFFQQYIYFKIDYDPDTDDSGYDELQRSGSSQISGRVNCPWVNVSS